MAETDLNLSTDPFKGFNESLYGNNWFVLSTFDGDPISDYGKAYDSNRVSYICGVLNKVPELKFNQTIVDGPQETFLTAIRKILRGKDSIAGMFGASMGVNTNTPFAGNLLTRRVVTVKEFMSDPIDLSFDAWKIPKNIFSEVCLPSSYSQVLDYLRQHGNLQSTDSPSATLEGKAATLLDHAGSNAIEAGKAVLTRLALIADQKWKDALIKWIDSPEAKILEYHKNSGLDEKSDSFDLGETLNKFLTAASPWMEKADDILVRSWNDEQRMRLGRYLFNAPLHRLDILRAGVLDTYFIVGITNWTFTLDQDSLGEKATVNIKVQLDQRLSRSRLENHLYSDKFLKTTAQSSTQS